MERGGSSVVGRGQSGPDRPWPTTLLPPSSNGKPEAATAVDKLLMMGTRMLETCWTVFKRQAINLRDWCIWLVDLFEYMMMHALTNPNCHFLLHHFMTQAIIHTYIKLSCQSSVSFQLLWNQCLRNAGCKTILGTAFMYSIQQRALCSHLSPV